MSCAEYFQIIYGRWLLASHSLRLAEHSVVFLECIVWKERKQSNHREEKPNEFSQVTEINTDSNIVLIVCTTDIM